MPQTRIKPGFLGAKQAAGIFICMVKTCLQSKKDATSYCTDSNRRESEKHTVAKRIKIIFEKAHRKKPVGLFAFLERIRRENRLEHTANNLSVMAENIQDAESTIRDTDVAEEMMAYTKNNILIQSAQAMLAQANAVPQGVLQLLG